jgi:hypothetical protein
MRTILWVAVSAILFASANEAQACGRRRGCRWGHPQAVYPQACSYSPVVYYSPPITFVTVPPSAASPAPATEVRAPQAASETEVRPLYTYEATPENGVAYYYTYDESGKLIIKQWMDWLFRGGRRAGLPAPPLPIIGRLND